MRDFRRLQQDPPQGVNGSPNPDNIMLWNAVIFGPEDTPWDGGACPHTLPLCKYFSEALEVPSSVPAWLEDCPDLLTALYLQAPSS